MLTVDSVVLKTRSCLLTLASPSAQPELQTPPFQWTVMVQASRPDQIYHPPCCLVWSHRALGYEVLLYCYTAIVLPNNNNLIVDGGSGWVGVGLCNSILFTWRWFWEIFREIETTYCAAFFLCLLQNSKRAKFYIKRILMKGLLLHIWVDCILKYKQQRLLSYYLEMRWNTRSDFRVLRGECLS